MDDFHVYTPIDLSTNAIRVLRLCRGYDTDPIVCEIVQIFLEDDGVPYEALSYTWGDVSVDVKITLNGHTKLVKDNLYTALHCLRRADQDRWLWVDALCIDQVNDREQSHQVNRMRLIYEKADRVLIWLGRTTDDIDLLMEMMTQFRKRVRRRDDYRRDQLDAWTREWPVLMKDSGGMWTDFNVRRRNGLIDLLRRPWFQRVWVLQEAFSAKRAAILCGRNEIATETFVVMPKLMKVETDDHVQSVLDIMPGYLRVTSWRNAQPDLRTLLKKFWRSRASDQRDSIYALLGISSDVRSSGKLDANYTIPFSGAIQTAVSYLAFGEVATCPVPEYGFAAFVASLDNLLFHILEWAITNGKDQTIKEVLSRVSLVQPPYSKIPFVLAEHVAVGQDKFSEIKHLLFSRDDFDINVWWEGSKDTLLHAAARAGNTSMAKALLSQGDLDPNAYNRDWQTPLSLAVENGRLPVVLAFLGHGSVDIDRHVGEPTARRCTALWLAAAMKAQDTMPVVEALIQHGAGIEARDTLLGETPLCVSAKEVNLDAMRMLILHGANIEARDMVGMTPICFAAKYGHVLAITTLLKAGADIQASSRGSSSPNTPLWLALHSSDTSAAEELLRNGARLEAGDSVVDLQRFVKGFNTSMRHVIDVFRKMGRSDHEIREEISRANGGETHGLEKALAWRSPTVTR